MAKPRMYGMFKPYIPNNRDARFIVKKMPRRKGKLSVEQCGKAAEQQKANGDERCV